MALSLDVSDSLRSSNRLNELVVAIYNAERATTPETHWVEWKSTLDFTTPKGKFSAAKAIIAFANRDPAHAARACGGEAYLVVGASTDRVINGIAPYDNADLEGMLKTYVAGPHWDADYVELKGNHVLVITVAPPAPGHRIHSLVKEYDKYASGTVFRRGVSKSAPATHRELDELQNRLLQSAPVPDAQAFNDALDQDNHSGAARIVRSALRTVSNSRSDTKQFPMSFASPSPAEQIREYVAIADHYLATTAPLLTLIVEGARESSPALHREWRQAMTTLAEPLPLPAAPGSLITARRDDRLDALALLPATLTMYGGTMAAVDHGNYEAVKALTIDGKVTRSIWNQGPKVTTLEKAGPWELVGYQLNLGVALRAAQRDQLTPELLASLASGDHPRARYPVSAYLHDALRPYFADHTDTHYSELFDNAEVTFSLIAADLTAQRSGYLREPWLGLFVQHAAESYPVEQSAVAQILDAALEAGEQWPPLNVGLFQGSTDHLRRAVNCVREATLEQALRGPF